MLIGIAKLISKNIISIYFPPDYIYFPNMIGKMWHAVITLICTFLIIVKVSIFRYFLSIICTSSSVNCLFIFLTHFYSGLLNIFLMFF